MANYPNYRIAVEIIIMHDEKVLLTKRSDVDQSGSGIWSVPVGKAKYTEIPVQALYREAKEETNLDVELIRELDVRAVQFKIGTEEYYLVIYSYLVKARGDSIQPLVLNEEHTEYAWVDLADLLSGRYPFAHENLSHLLVSTLNKEFIQEGLS